MTITPIGKASALMTLLALALSADALVLKNGRRVQGTLKNADSTGLQMLVDSKVESFSISEIVSLHIEGPVQSGSHAATLPPIEIPNGTTITVSTLDHIDSQNAREGHVFRASLDRPIAAGGRMLSPAGSDVFVRLVRASHSGSNTGTTEFAIVVDAVIINGTRVYIDSTEAASSSPSRRGGGIAAESRAAIASAVGVFGRRRGSRARAATTAGAAVVEQVITSGERVVIPIGTRLSFQVLSTKEMNDR